MFHIYSFSYFNRVYCIKKRYPQQWKRFFSKTKSLFFLKIIKTVLAWLPLKMCSSVGFLDEDYLIICCHVLYKFWWSALAWTIPAGLAGYRQNFSLSCYSYFIHLQFGKNNPEAWNWHQKLKSKLKFAENNGNLAK